MFIQIDSSVLKLKLRSFNFGEFCYSNNRKTIQPITPTIARVLGSKEARLLKPISSKSANSFPRYRQSKKIVHNLKPSEKVQLFSLPSYFSRFKSFDFIKKKNMTFEACNGLTIITVKSYHCIYIFRLS